MMITGIGGVRSPDEPQDLQPTAPVHPLRSQRTAWNRSSDSRRMPSPGTLGGHHLEIELLDVATHQLEEAGFIVNNQDPGSRHDDSPCRLEDEDQWEKMDYSCPSPAMRSHRLAIWGERCSSSLVARCCHKYWSLKRVFLCDSCKQRSSRTRPGLSLAKKVLGFGHPCGSCILPPPLGALRGAWIWSADQRNLARLQQVQFPGSGREA